MAIVSVGAWYARDGTGVELDLNLGWLTYGAVKEETPSLYTLDARGVEDTWGPSVLHKFYGSGFTYDDSGKLSSGVVASWDAFLADDTKYFSITGLSLPARTFTEGLEHAVYIAPVIFDGDDSMAGSFDGDDLWGFNGNDTIMGGGGDDTIVGGGPAGVFSLRDPADHLYGYAFSPADGSNYLRGDAGNDTLSGGGGFDDINGNMGNDTAYGGPGDDWVVGGKDNDVLYGDEGSDIVLGNLGTDTLDGGGGNDLLRGGQDNDSLSGGDGADWLSGDLGSDTISGGDGADIFHSFSAAGLDRVLDFNRAEADRVQLDPGTTYAVSQVGADVVIDMTGGAQMVLVGVSMASLTDGWIIAA